MTHGRERDSETRAALRNQPAAAGYPPAGLRTRGASLHTGMEGVSLDREGLQRAFRPTQRRRGVPNAYIITGSALRLVFHVTVEPSAGVFVVVFVFFLSAFSDRVGLIEGKFRIQLLDRTHAHEL